jgi:hypothetical protein
MVAPVLQFKRGNLSNLPGLRAGEPAFTTDSYDFYVGLTSETSTNKFFGSHRYWSKETTTKGSGVNVVEGTSNGSSYITLKSPDSLSGIVTYTLPGSDGTNNQVLATNGSGVLSFIDAAAALDISGDSGTDTVDLLTDTLAFVGTSNEIETTVTNNQVQIGLSDDVTIGNSLTVTGDASVGSALTVTGTVDFNGGADISGGETILSSATVSDLTDNRVVIAGTSGALEDSSTLTYDGTDLSTNSLIVTDLTDNRVLIAGSGGAVEDSGNLTFDGSTLTVVGYTDLDDVNVSSAATITTADIGTATIDSLTFTSGTAITSVDTNLSSVSASDDTLASAKAIKSYVDSQVAAQDLDFSGDSGTGAVDLDSQTLSIAGTANEIETSASGQTLTVGLPDSVTVTTALTTPTVNVTNVKANDGTTAITIADSTGAVETNSNLTVQGNLIVNGSTTQVNTSQTTIEDQILELGMVDGSAPSSDLNKDLGVIFNYYTASAKKAAVYWDDSTSRIVISDDVTESTGVLTPASHAALEIGSLWVNDCAGQSQVINCSGSERLLENITIDGGSF